MCCCQFFENIFTHTGYNAVSGTPTPMRYRGSKVPEADYFSGIKTQRLIYAQKYRSFLTFFKKWLYFILPI